MRLNNYSNYVRICNKCHKYFISKKSDQRNRYCEKCSSKHGVKKKSKEKKERIEEMKKSAAIKRMMAANYTEEQAKEIYESDKEIK